MKTVINYLQRLRASIKRYNVRNQTLHELSKLTTRELSDIGLTKGDIWNLAHEDAKRRIPDPKPVEKKTATNINPNLKGFV